MAYIQGGDVRGGRSPWSMNFIRDTCSELLNFVVSFVKTMFSLDNGRPRGPAAGPVRGVGRAPVSVAPPATNIVADLSDSVVGDHGNVHVVTSAEEWQTKVNGANATGRVVSRYVNTPLTHCILQIVVDFFATWCGPCKKMAPVFEELSKKVEYQALVFVKIDIEEVSDVAAIYDVRSMPTFLFIRDGQQIDKVVGANKIELERKCSQYATSR